jgi:hypothetical protein
MSLCFIMPFRVGFYLNRRKLPVEFCPGFSDESSITDNFSLWKVKIKRGFNYYYFLNQNYLVVVAVYSTRHFRDDQKRQGCTDPRNPH